MLKACTCDPNPQKAPTSNIKENAILDESFECMQRMAQGMCRRLARPKDREICMEMLERLDKYNRSTNLEVKRNVNKFTRFYLKVLRWTQIHQPVSLYQQWYGAAATSGGCSSGAAGGAGYSSCTNATMPSVPDDGSLGELRVWLESQRSYLAMKTYEDGSTIIYAAVAKQTAPGWVEGGLKEVQRNPDCIECVDGSCT